MYWRVPYKGRIMDMALKEKLHARACQWHMEKLMMNGLNMFI
jgi:hypothetical protein